MKDLKSVNEPIDAGYRLEDEYNRALKKLPKLKDYFPHYDEMKYSPPKKYFWEVYHTLDPKAAQKSLDRINNAVKRRK